MPTKPRFQIPGLCLLSLSLMATPGCVGTSSGSMDNQSERESLRQYPLDTLPTATIGVDEQSLRVWLAREQDQSRPNLIQEGLMHVPPERLAEDQGMLFVFDTEQIRSFWMLNTITPLDIAFARADGTIVTIWQMPPLTLESFSSLEPAMFALEMKQGSFEQLGIEEGDRLRIPNEVFATD